MSKTFLTRCPHCSTRFRVNSQQLFAAQGAVRCGSCMQVFNARLFLEQDSSQQAEPDTLDSLKIHDDMDIDLDSPDFEQELARLARQEAEEHSEPAWSSPSACDEGQEKAHSHKEADAPPIQPLGYAAIADLPPNPDESDSNEHEDNESELPVFPHETQSPALTAIDDADDDHSVPPASGRRYEPVISADDFDAIDDGPLMLEWQPAKHNRLAWVWALLCLLAASGLVLQYGLYNLEQLARQPAVRPWLHGVCNLLGCKVPEQVDVSLITSSNLVVRPHAEFAQALSVDAIIYNRASFAQPFPLLQLNFMDDNQQVLASRNFRPDEYLGGELAGRSSMPAQTPIRIALDVLVPDVQASRYNLRFLPPG